jgi:hypothetical protein
MVEQDDAADADLLFQEFDFPENYVNMAHPNDGTIMSTPAERLCKFLCDTPWWFWFDSFALHIKNELISTN